MNRHSSNQLRASVLYASVLASKFSSLLLYSQWIRGFAMSSLMNVDNRGNRLDFLRATRFKFSDELDAPVIIKKCFTRAINKPIRSSISKNDQNVTVRQQEMLVKKIIRNVQFSKKHSQYKIQAIQDYHSTKKSKGRWLPHWREIENILIKTSPTLGPRLERAVQIKIPPAWARKFLCSVDDFFIRIGEIHDCTVELAGPDDSHIYTSFILSGPDLSIKSLLTFIVQSVPCVKIIHNHENSLFVRYVSSKQRRPRILAHMLSRPEKWTSMSLLEYVEDLTAYDPSYHYLRFIHSPLSSNKANYCNVIMNIIRELIVCPIARPMFSREAIHRAMRYFLRKDRINYMRELYTHMDYIGLKHVTETYNIMLRASAMKKDLHDFHFILHMMLSDGLKPDGETWVAFIMALPDYKVKNYLFNRMKLKGLLSKTKTLQNTVEQLVENDLEVSIRQNQDHNSFIEGMNQKYGSKWHSVDVANRVLAVFGRYNLLSRTFQYLKYMEECFIYPNKYSINTLLHSCSLSSNPGLALIELLNFTKLQTQLQPDQESCRILFKLAWATGSFNIAKVVWRFACLSATTSSILRTRVARSLRQSLLTSESEDKIFWNRYAGSIIIGSKELQHPVLAILDNSKIIDKKLFDSVCVSKLLEENNNERSINLDLQIFKYWRPSKPFGEVLWQAIERDIEWKIDDVFSNKDSSWLTKNSISVQISEKYGKFRCINWI